MDKRNVFLKIIAFILSLFSTFCVFSSISMFAASDIKLPNTDGAQNVYLYNFESDKVIYTKTSNTKKIAPASTVKIMTGLVAIDLLGDRLEENVYITDDMLAGVEGVTVGFKQNTTVKIKDLMHGLICGSGNDAAYMLANISLGSIEAFVERMNKKADDLGCLDTFYTNPTGIDDPRMTTSLADTVKISKEAIKTPLFMKICALPSYTFSTPESGTKTFYNRNALISSFSAIGYQNKNVRGLNAGMTDNGGYCVSAYATNGKDSYLCIIMNATQRSDGKIMSYNIANNLLNYVLENYTYAQIAQKGDVVGQLPVELALPTNGSDTVTVNCVLENDIYAFAPDKINYKTDLDYRTYYHSETLKAPVSKNTVVGGVDIYYNDTYITSAKLITQTDVNASALLLTLKKMKSYTLSRTVILFFIISAVLIFIYFIITRKRKSRKKFH